MKNLYPGIIAMALIVVASNILVQHPMGAFLTFGALTYPLSFLVNDITNRLQGACARRGSWCWRGSSPGLDLLGHRHPDPWRFWAFGDCCASPWALPQPFWLGS